MTKVKLIISAVLLTGLQVASFSGVADKSAVDPNVSTEGETVVFRDTLEASIIRGELVYGNYCVLCHGRDADGKGRAARIYDPKPANLLTSKKPDAYHDLIIRRGGAEMGRSEFMPAWQEELTDEQIGDVVAYLRSINVSNP